MAMQTSPASPRLNSLNSKTVRHHFPKYAGTHEFEIVWSACQTALRQSCDSETNSARNMYSTNIKNSLSLLKIVLLHNDSQWRI